MKASTSIKEYCRKRNKSVLRIFTKPGKTISIEDYHSLRVEIKKLRAVFALVNFSVKQFKHSKTLKPYLSIFEQAGKVRDIQLEELTLKKLNLSKPLKNYLIELIGQRKLETETFLKLANNKHVKKIKEAHEKISEAAAQVKYKDIESFLKKKRRKIDMYLMLNKLEEVSVHDLRKRLKEYYYVLKMFYPENKSISELRSFMELLGKWNDLFMMHKDLKKSLDLGNLPPIEKKLLEKLSENILLEIEKVLKTINTDKKRLDPETPTEWNVQVR
ncbi:MAG: CHAD domain-containing protein [Bacteroidota bacterium]|nr:CHAD domain-containing protein [Bacteroidota bacterium]